MAAVALLLCVAFIHWAYGWLPAMPKIFEVTAVAIAGALQSLLVGGGWLTTLCYAGNKARLQLCSANLTRRVDQRRAGDNQLQLSALQLEAGGNAPVPVPVPRLSRDEQLIRLLWMLPFAMFYALLAFATKCATAAPSVQKQDHCCMPFIVFCANRVFTMRFHFFPPLKSANLHKRV
jgi:hypothetical protein